MNGARFEDHDDLVLPREVLAVAILAVVGKGVLGKTAEEIAQATGACATELGRYFPTVLNTVELMVLQGRLESRPYSARTPGPLRYRVPRKA